jgi:hypothetical protein
LHPSETYEVYPFVECGDAFRPSDGPWTPNRSNEDTPVFVYVSAAVADKSQHSLLFVKVGGNDNIRFCGVMPFKGTEHIIERSEQLRQICGIPVTTGKFQLLDYFNLTQFHWVDAAKTFDEMKLKTGSILVVHDGPDIKTSPIPEVIGKRYSHHLPEGNPFPKYRNSLKKELYQHAIVGHCTDVVIASATTVNVPFHVTAHKVVLSTVRYFQTMFESGLKESQNSAILMLEAPEWVEKHCLTAFISYLYLRQEWILSQLTVENLTNLLRLADYYSFDLLLDAVVEVLVEKYSQLTDLNTLGLLRVIDSMEFYPKGELVEFLAEYMAYNFSRIAQNMEFIKLFETDIYRTVVSIIGRKCRANQNMDLYY